MIFDEFLELLPKINNLPLSGESSHFKMVPPFRKELMKKQEQVIKSAKQAAVLALFYPNAQRETCLVLILRKTYQGVHSAQIGFPGGKLEEQDVSLKQTALRETFEEIGVAVEDITIFKNLTAVYIPPSNFNVFPFMALSRITPVFAKQDSEVEAILEVKLQDFIDDSALIEKTVQTSYSLEIDVPAFKLNGYVVWGATAMMLSEIKDLFKQVF